MFNISNMCHQFFLGGFYHIQDIELKDVTSETKNACSYRDLKVIYIFSKTLTLLSITAGLYVSISSLAALSCCVIVGCSFSIIAFISKQMHNDIMENEDVLYPIYGGTQRFFLKKLD